LPVAESQEVWKAMSDVEPQVRFATQAVPDLLSLRTPAKTLPVPPTRETFASCLVGL
jgi:hypothetical protein